MAIFVLATIQAGGFAMVAVIYGIGLGGRIPLTTAIRGDYFGQRAFATITGISMVPLYGFALAAPLFRRAMFDIRGSYFLPLIILGILGGFSGPFFLLAKRPSSIVPREDLNRQPSRPDTFYRSLPRRSMTPSATQWERMSEAFSLGNM